MVFATFADCGHIQKAFPNIPDCIHEVVSKTTTSTGIRFSKNPRQPMFRARFTSVSRRVVRGETSRCVSPIFVRRTHMCSASASVRAFTPTTASARRVVATGWAPKTLVPISGLSKNTRGLHDARVTPRLSRVHAGISVQKARRAHVTNARDWSGISGEDFEFEDDGTEHEPENDELLKTEDDAFALGFRNFFSPSRASDSDWLDDDRFGCTHAQLVINACACVIGFEVPKHSTDLVEFYRKLSAEIEHLGTGRGNGSLDQTVTWWAEHIIAFCDTRANEIHWAAHHPNEVLGFAAVALTFFVPFRLRFQKTMALKKKLLTDGVDLTNVAGTVETLEYLSEMKKRDELPLALEVCAFQKAKNEVKYLGVEALKDWRTYYGSRGIDLATKNDVQKIKLYVNNLRHLEGCWRSNTGEV